MDLPPFLLDRFLATYEFASPPIRYNLAASTGPVWTLGELMALGGDAQRELDKLRLSYVPPQGTQPLRQRIADFHDVDPDWVIVTTGASEALSALYALAAEPGASIVLPHPAFPAMPARRESSAGSGWRGRGRARKSTVGCLRWESPAIPPPRWESRFFARRR